MNHWIFTIIVKLAVITPLLTSAYSLKANQTKSEQLTNEGAGQSIFIVRELPPVSETIIFSLAMLPNGDFVSRNINAIYIFDSQTGFVKREISFTVHDAFVPLIVLNNGSLLTRAYRSIVIFDPQTGESEWTEISQMTVIRTLTVLQGGQIVAGHEDGTVTVCSGINFANQIQLPDKHTEAVMSLAADDRSGLLASGSFDKTIKIWNIFKNYRLERTLQPPSDPKLNYRWDTLLCLAWMADGNLASGSIDNKIFIWNASSWSIKFKLIGHSSQISSLKVLLNGDLVSTGINDNLLIIWNTETGFVKSKIKGLTVRDTVILPDDMLAATSDGAVNIYKVKVNSYVKMLWRNHSSCISALAILPNGDLCSGSWDQTIKVWRSSGVLRHTLVGHTDAVNSLAVTTGGLLVSGSRDSTVKVWDPVNGVEAFTLRLHAASIECLAALADGHVASGSADRSIKIWQAVPGGQLKFTLVGHSEVVTALTVLGSGLLASGSLDKTIRVWNLADGSLQRTLRANMQDVTALLALPYVGDGVLASASMDRRIRIWDINDGGRLLRTIEGHAYYVSALQTLPNGDLVSASWDQTIRVWSGTSEGRLKAILQPYDLIFSSLAVQVDGSIVSGSQDGSILIWHINE